MRISDEKYREFPGKVWGKAKKIDRWFSNGLGSHGRGKESRLKEEGKGRLMFLFRR
jgi:hypothetical protein